MTLEEMENEIRQLKEQVAANAWAKDHLEIWKLTSLYSHLYYLGRNPEVVNRMHRSPGWLAVHMTCNPVLEINRKGTKAAGIWHSHGFVSMVSGESYKQNLCMGKYIFDYIKEDGSWKFHHFNYRIAFMCPYRKGWVEEPIVASIAGNPKNEPDKPITYHLPYSRYRINVMEPGPPEPYTD